jgi:hypothetical protein
MNDIVGTEITQTPTATPTATPAPATQEHSVAATTTPTAIPPAAATPQPSNDAMVPSYRLRETREQAIREAQNQFAQREAQYQAQLEAVQRQLHALVGVTPQGDPEIDQVRDQFGRIYPGLTQLEERAEAILQVLERAGDLESQTDHYWRSYGRQSMDRIYEKAAVSLGGPLTDAAKQTLHTAFTGFVASSPEVVNRYANDPSLVDEFWTSFSSTFIDPVRRTAAVGAVARTGTPLPTDSPSGALRTTPAPQFKNLDERSAAAWAQYQSGKTGG